MSSDLQAQEETFLAREFLGFMGYRVVSLRPGDRPDTRADIERDGQVLRVGIELTTYQVDAGPGAPGGSPGVRLHGFWKAVQEELLCLLNTEPALRHLHGFVTLRHDVEPAIRDARALALELIALAMHSLPICDGQEKEITRFGPMSLLCKYASEVTLRNVAPVIMHHWECANVGAAFVGIDLNHIRASICQKSKKCATYDWSGVDQRWLLICAPGYPVVCTAGPEPGSVNWDAQPLREVSSTSGFDRIFFWERYYSWCKPIWPDGWIIQKEWRTRRSHQ